MQHGSGLFHGSCLFSKYLYYLEDLPNSFNTPEMTGRKETKPENLWVGEDKHAGQLWLYDPVVSEDRALYLNGDVVDLFRIEDYGLKSGQSVAPPGRLQPVDRVEYRKKLRTIKDENRRKHMIDAYLKWLRYQEFYGDSSPITDGPGFSDALSDRAYIVPTFNSDS